MKILSLFLLIACGIVYAQNAQLSGLVTDRSDAAIPDAEVSVMNQETGVSRNATSNREGYYSVPALQPGKYKVTVQAKGFQTVSREAIKLEVEQNARLDFKLTVGTVETAITVTGETPLINTESPAVSTVVTREQVENMPLNGRSFQSLITLTPGVVLSTLSSAGSSGQFSVNGQRTNSNYFMVDGASGNIGTTSLTGRSQDFAGATPAFGATGGTNGLVSIEAMQEFRVLTSNFAPEYGRTVGGQIQIATRSGTNQFHASLFNYLRNNIFDANDWFANSNGLTRAPLRQNDFGGVLGGPVRRDRTFFFFSFEGLRLRQPKVATRQVPSLAMRQSAAPGLRTFLDAFPLPNGPALADPTTGQPTGYAQETAGYSDPSTLDSTSIRIDHKVSDRLSLFARYSDSPSQTGLRGGGVNAASLSLSVLQTQIVNLRTVTTGATWLASARAVNEFRFNYSQSRGAGSWSLDTLGGAVVPPESFFFPPSQSPQGALSTYLLALGSGAEVLLGDIADDSQRQINLVDSQSWSLGSHQLKFGADYRRLTPEFGVRPYGLTVIFSSFANLQSGVVSSASVFGARSASPEFQNLSLFWQDTWRARPRLTLTYGVRWDLNPAPHAASGTDVLTLTGLDSPAHYAVAPAGTPLYKARYNDIGPRVGLAYQLSQAPGRETVIRGGIGIFYDMVATSAASAYLNYPFAAQTQRFTNVPYPLTAAQLAPAPFNLNPPITGGISAFAPGFNLPYSVQWNVAVERALGSQQSLSASYVGSLGRRDIRTETQISPNPTFAGGTVTLVKGDATSDYDALQLEFHRRLSRGLEALASYTWSHALDDISVETSVIEGTSRGNSSFDTRHAFSASVAYSLPAPRLVPFANAILRDWGLDTIVTTRSAPPVDLIGRSTTVLGGIQVVARPDLKPGMPLYLYGPGYPGGRRINPFAFTVPPTTRQGTLGRDVLRGFPLNQVDLALRRQFKLSERFTMQLRLEAFNVLNHPNFGGIAANLTSGLFGLSTNMFNQNSLTGGGLNSLYQVGGPRSMQVSLKLKF